MNSPQKNAVSIASLALSLCVLEWVWLDWRFDGKIHGLREDLAYLQGELAAMQDRDWSGEHPAKPERSDEQLRRALERLGRRNILDRYQAGMTVRAYGERAVPELVELVRSGSSRARESALVILGDLESPTATPHLREIASLYFASSSSTGSPSCSAAPVPSPKTVAAILGLLAGMKDQEALPLFRHGLKSPEESVRTAAIVGMRRFGSVDLLPELLGRLGKEKRLVHKQLEEAIRGLCHRDPGNFSRGLKDAPPSSRFALVKLLSQDRSAAALQVLRTLTKDGDPRVALGATRVLVLRGDTSSRAVAERLAADAPTEELQGLAEEILKQFTEGKAE
ncbi:MAG: HEAT repeat domain-containing protein [Lentisphaerae bacterium]|jgi:HEAT repeat protein|nr:HEAT repeat domain-containing protein [Lentisphaerota bacterium]MBT4817998.1 HEAT repeat domain-containing protein [Lentisphaerota bacterium]MBT5607245.1 HEAT repeat domain-containing protein [Lentisphaerota bacterium]MBT7058826.1 HEAT repeat domain-containing protein [Lentisphaerota bacterium]MBT7842364.1 HEAT repeat domain-containing protein [Lentisphaerota bacterium]